MKVFFILRVVAVIFCVFLTESGTYASRRRRRRRYVPPDTSPPAITGCPNVIQRTLYPGQTRVYIGWQLDVHDSRNGNVGLHNPVGLQPYRSDGRVFYFGDYFELGSYTNSYPARDYSGNIATCTVTVNVKATFCPSLPQPTDGYVTCSQGEAEGSVCRYSCQTGFARTSGTEVRACINGYWTGSHVVCSIEDCGTPPAAPSNSRMACTRNTYYGSICTYECEDGYFPANNSTYIPSVQRSCLASRVWTNTTDTEFSCVDVEAPTFPNCPSPISAQAEKGTVSAVVSWAAPGAEDNSGEDVQVSQTVGQRPGSRFEEGFHTIVYTATDSVMNSANCSFTVTVTTPKCSRLQPLQYGSILCDNQHNYGSTCTYTCDEGYFFNGDPTTKCELDLTTDATYWDPSTSQHNCQPVQCPQLPAIQNGGWLVNTTCSNTFGSYCYFQCDPGFKLQGDSTVSCKASVPGQSTGVWDGNIPTCIESTCSSLGSIANGRIIFDQGCPFGNVFSTGSVCGVSCSPGHVLIGSSSLTCLLDGTWNASLPSCEVITCDSAGLPTPTNGYKLGCPDSEEPYGATCIIGCNTGYEPAIPVQRTCIADGNGVGQWSNGTISCKEIKCTHLPKPNNGNITACYHDAVRTEPEQSQSVGAVCSTMCNEGYTAAGSAERTCLPGGGWNGTELRCRDLAPPVLQCPDEIILVANEGQDTATVDWHWEPVLANDAGKDIVSALSGSTTRETELPEGRHFFTYEATDAAGNRASCTMAIDVRVIRCPGLPSVVNGVTTLVAGKGTCSGGSVRGSQCEVTCDAGYSMADGSTVTTRTCHRTGNDTLQASWTGPVPVCTGVTCPLPTIVNGFVFGCNPPEAIYGASCEFHCNRGYKGPANETDVTRTCRGNGTFTGEPLLCNPIKCSGLATVENGLVIPATCLSPSVSNGEICIFNCDPGYSIMGPFSKQCLPDGMWSDTRKTSCKDHEPPRFTGQCPTYVNAIGDAGKTSATVLFTEPAATDNSNYVNVSRAANQRGPGDDFQEGTTVVTYVAKDAANNRAQCDVFVVVRVHRCPMVQAPASGAVNCSGDFYGSKCQYRCNEGYMLDGSPFRHCVLSADGSSSYWNGSQPVCRAVECPALATPANAVKSGCFNEPPTTERFGTVCSFYCNYGYSGSGVNSARCLSDGTWTSFNFVCERASCSPLALPADVSATPSSCQVSSDVGDTCILSCSRTGYRLTPQSGQFVICLGDGQWSSNVSSLVCSDIEKPRFSQCPQDQTFYADRGSQSTFVNWTVSAIDNSGKIPTVTCSQSPTMLPAGDYQVSCTATDAAGNTETCLFDIRVKVRRCQQLLPPLYGTFVGTCETAYGSTCQVTCTAGYQLEGSDTATCEMQGNNAVWDRTTNPVCQALRCAPLSTPANVGVFPSNCVGPGDVHRGTACSFDCRSGYQLEGDGRTITCNLDGAWDRNETLVPSGCIDITAPTLLTCPGPQYGTITDSSFLGVSVSFDIPQATDNSGETLSTTKLPVDITSPYNFTADTVVTYEFRDSGGNSVTCTFMVYVKGELPPNVIFCPDDLTITATDRLAEVSWPEPLFDDPTGGDLDVSANIANNGSLPWGDHSVTYTATNVDNGKSVTCTFLVIVRPVACPPLNPPLHGALACDTWVYGKFCSMFCSAQYDIPRGSNPGDKYICGASGMWSPPPPVPDCVSSFRPNRFVLPSELHYFSGDCSDPSVQADIAQRFVTILNGSDFGSACSDSVGCSWENVEVVCGANSRRRSLGRQSKLVTGQMTDIPSRSSGQYLLTMKFSLVVNMTDDDPNLSSVDRYYAADDQLLVMTDVIQAEIYSGDFDVSVPGLSLQVDQNSLTYGWSELDCPKGYAEQPDSMNCVGCPTGTYYDEGADDCLKCSVGFYQDEEGQFQCKTCPLGTSTVDEGARNLTECLDLCPPGSYSNTRVVPCTKCDIGYYQEQEGHTSCNRCNASFSTMTIGSTSGSDCKEFCPAGTYSDNGFVQCSPCPRRYYQPSIGQQQCLLCPGMTTTLSEGTMSSSNCIELDACVSNPCGNGGVCNRLIEGYACVCLSGFTGYNCEVNIDDCARNPCVNNAACVDGIDNYSCVCSHGYTGNTCEEDIDDCQHLPCRNNGACEDRVGSFICHCQPGFVGDTCEITVDACYHHECKNSANCVSQATSYECVCPNGFTGDLCETNIDDCRGNPCLHNGVCVDGVMDFTCLCTMGYMGSLCEVDVDLCDSGPCLNSGTCVDLGDDFACQCVEGLSGKTCESARDPCSPQPCLNGGSCTVQPHTGDYVCSCAQGFAGMQCEIDINECASGPCSNDAICLDGINHYSCACTNGFVGHNCEEAVDHCASAPCGNNSTCLSERDGYRCICPPTATGPTCGTPVDPCTSAPCLNNGSCVVDDNGYTCYCSPDFTGPTCDTEEDSCEDDPCANGGLCTDGFGTFSCACPDGYTGFTCEQEIDECTSNPCQNSGVCVDKEAGYDCLCPKGTSGNYCEENFDDCHNVTCLNGGSCIDLVSAFLCNCSPGYEGKFCESEINECNIYPCRNARSCRDLLNDYECECEPGWTGKNCETNIDDCFPNPCGNGGVCHDRVNSYTCSCLGGFSGLHCEVNIDECMEVLCENNGTCVDGVGTASCVCGLGWTGTYCQVEIDECSLEPCMNGGGCVDTIGSFVCNCVDGFTGRLCEEDINDCEIPRCMNGGTCVDQVARYMCRCPPGYTGTNCEVNINECSSQPCRNGGQCIDESDGFVCVCPQGFSGRTCDVNIDDCIPNMCENGATCLDGIGDYTCICKLGFSGRRCEVDVDDCAGRPCENSATCLDGVNEYTCLCPPGYSGVRCEYALPTDFDIHVTSSDSNHYSEVSKQNIHGMSAIAWWMRAMDAPNNYVPVTVAVTRNNSDAREPLFVVQNPNQIEVVLSGTIIQSSVNCADGGWHHVAVSYEPASEVLALYVDGMMENTTRVPSLQNSSPADGFVISVATGVTNANIGDFAFQGEISQLNAWARELSQAEIVELSSTCQTVAVGDAVAWSDFVDATQTDPQYGAISSPSVCDSEDQCESSPCFNAGTCKDGYLTFTCTCPRSHVGHRCETQLNPCDGNLCQNGAACVADVTSMTYTCSCPGGFSGDLCNVLSVNGGWSEWSQWSACTATCGNSTRSRQRLCDNPPPLGGGNPCAGVSLETEACTNIPDCTQCTELRHPENGYLVCSPDGVDTKCEVHCRAGFMMVVNPDLYVGLRCGPSTWYTWTHQDLTNLPARIPGCTKKELPTSVTVDYVIRYKNVSEDPFANLFTQQILGPSASILNEQAYEHAFDSVVTRNLLSLACIVSHTCHKDGSEVRFENVTTGNNTRLDVVGHIFMSTQVPQVSDPVLTLAQSSKYSFPMDVISDGFVAGNPALTFVGNPSLIDGISGKAISLDGQAQYLNAGQFPGECLGSSVYCPNGYTITAWLRVNSVPSSPSQDVYYLSNGGQTSSSRGFAVGYKGGFFARVSFDSRYRSLAFSVDLHTWFNIALTWSPGGDPTLYINGTRVNATVTDGSLSALASDTRTQFLIGAPNNIDNPSSGHLGHTDVDNVLFWDRVLTHGEILNLMSVEPVAVARICRGQHLTLSCEPEEVITIHSAIFKVSAPSDCGALDPSQIESCVEDAALEFILNLCDGQRSCHLHATDEVFGNDCVETRNSFEVLYTCDTGRFTDKDIIMENIEEDWETTLKSLSQMVENGDFDLNVLHQDILADKNITEEIEIQLTCTGNMVGIGLCANCTAGSYRDSESTGCKPCDFGSFQEEEGQEGCDSCPTGKTTFFVGATQSSDCVDACFPGSFYNGRECAPCPQGQFQSPTTPTKCESCPPGYTTVGFGSVDVAACYDPMLRSVRRKRDESTDVDATEDDHSRTKALVLPVIFAVSMVVALSFIGYLLTKKWSRG
ncbi:uncharacterized protein LOC144881802 isoform X2 [Branchiostoma floridae x Branchiostoma japonicum]